MGLDVRWVQWCTICSMAKVLCAVQKQAVAGPQKPKDAPNPELPSWLKDRIQVRPLPQNSALPPGSRCQDGPR